eukprot:10908264-Alexandrium_andersonii.AAC.1
MRFETGDVATSSFEIADVSRPVSSASSMCDKGNAVVFLPGLQSSFMCRADHLQCNIQGPAVNIKRK